MERAELLRAGPALDAFLEGFRECALAPTRRLIAAYLRGQLGPLPRKSVLPMAVDAGIPPRTLQELLSLHRWDEETFLDLLQRRVAARKRSGPRVLFFADLLVPKKGAKTPGVDRQRDELGRARNGVRLVQLALTEDAFLCSLETDLYLPAGWAGDLERRREASIPDVLRYRHPWEIALDLLDRALRNGMSPDWVLFPTSFGEAPAFLAGLSERKLGYVTEASRGGGKGPREGRTLSAAPGIALTTSSAEAAPAALLELWRSRERLARRLDELKLDVGHDHFEVRSWRSLRRHLLLSSASALFLSELRERQARPADADAPLRAAR